jgi:hypothetical protein
VPLANVCQRVQRSVIVQELLLGSQELARPKERLIECLHHRHCHQWVGGDGPAVGQLHRPACRAASVQGEGVTSAGVRDRSACP